MTERSASHRQVPSHHNGPRRGLMCPGCGNPRSDRHCDGCHSPNPPWVTDREIWHRYVPEDEGWNEEGFFFTVLCPYCFAARMDTGAEASAFLRDLRDKQRGQAERARARRQAQS